jgi:hypothetical protein
MQTTKFFAGLLLACLFFTACQKEQTENLINSNQNKTFPMPSNGFRSGLPTMPSLQNGMLKFADQNQFDEYLSYLDALVMDEPQTESAIDTDSTEFDAKLLQVETNLNFSSLRAQLLADFELLNQEGFVTLEAIPAEHFIPSSAYRSVFNTNLEVKVGTAIYVYYNENWLIEITDGSISSRDEIRALRKQFPDELPTAIISMDNIEPKSLAGVKIKRWKNGGTNLVLTIEPPTCANPLQRVIRADIIDRTFPTRFEWTINGNVIIQNVAAGQTSLTFTFPSSGTYNISVEAFNTYMGANASIFVANQSVTISNASCVDNMLTSTTQWNYCNGRAYSSFIRKYIPLTLFGTTDTKYEAITKSYTWNGSVWQHKKIERISVQLWAATRDPNNACSVLNSGFGAVWSSNARTAERSFRLGGISTQNNDLYSIHQVRQNNQNCSITRLLQSCP